jgi:hypothetical protein
MPPRKKAPKSGEASKAAKVPKPTIPQEQVHFNNSFIHGSRCKFMMK